MTDPDTVISSIKEAIKDSGRPPTSTSYATFEIDQEGGQANVRPPVVEITPASDVIRSSPHNTELVGYATDSNDNQIGRVYRSNFDMTVQIDVWTAEGDQYDPDQIGRDVWDALFEYDSTRRNPAPLPDPGDSGYVTDIERFHLEDGGVRNDLTMTPALRRWRQTADVWFHDELDTSEEYGAENYVANVVTPEDGSFTSSDGVLIEFSAT